MGKIDLTPAQRAPTAEARGHIHRLLSLVPNPDADRDPFELFNEALAQVTRQVGDLRRDSCADRREALQLRGMLFDLLRWADALDMQATVTLELTSRAGLASSRPLSAPASAQEPVIPRPSFRERLAYRLLLAWHRGVLEVRFLAWKAWASLRYR